MDARVLRQLGVEGEAQEMALADADHLALIAGYDLDSGSHLLDPGSPDEDPGEGHLFPNGKLELNRTLKAVDLAAESVAPHGHVEDAQQWLRRFHRRSGQHDETRAGAEDRLLAREITERLRKAELLHELAHGRALASGNDEGIQLRQLIR